MSDKESSITAETLAQLMGVGVETVAEIRPYGCPVSGDGTYPASRAIKAAFAWMRDRWEVTTNKEVAGWLGVTNARVSHMIRDGTLSQNSDGRLPRQKVIFEIIKHFQERSKAKADTTDDKKEKTRLEKELLQIQLDKARGVTLQAHEVEAAWSNVLILAKQRLLRIPNKVAPRLPFAKSEVEMEAEIAKEIDEALNELSRPPLYEREESDPA